MLITVVLILLIVAGAWLLPRLIQVPATVVSDPVLGTLNLAGSSCESLARADREKLSPLFDRSWSSEGEHKPCDVLLLYCDIGDNGEIVGQKAGIRELIRDCGATVVIVANGHRDEYSPNGFGKQTGYGHANLVLTLDRKGDCFAEFFFELFSRMFNGVAMPMAWHQLAPQIPNQEAGKLPESICLMERGQVTFKRSDATTTTSP